MSDKSTDRSAADIERDLVQARAELAATVDALSDRLNPKKRMEETKAELKVAAQHAGDQAKAFGKDLADDKPRLGIVVGAVVLAVVGLLLLRRRDLSRQHVHHWGNPH